MILLIPWRRPWRFESAFGSGLRVRVRVLVIHVGDHGVLCRSSCRPSRNSEVTSSRVDGLRGLARRIRDVDLGVIGSLTPGRGSWSGAGFGLRVPWVLDV